jgi:phosphatidylserine decarboxylase
MKIKIAKGCLGWTLTPIIFLLLFLLFLLYYNNLWFISGVIPFLCVTIFFLIFFRDPERKIGEGIVAPADGKIREVKSDKKQTFISIFMEVNNVHVNRMPIEGKITSINHYPGKHLRAWKKESDLNEKVIIDIKSSIGKIQVVQLAGLIARRVYPYIKKGDELKKGDRIGIIRLGSRVDVYLPSSKIKKIVVKVDDPVKAGLDTIAIIN